MAREEEPRLYPPSLAETRAYYGITPAIPLRLPGEDELPYSDGENLETDRHALQSRLLIEPLYAAWQDRNFFAGGNNFVYFSDSQVMNNDFRGPDVYVVMDVPRRERKSWVAWENDGRVPDVVVELLSVSTAHIDKGEKMFVYRDRMRLPEYFWFDPFDADDWAGFRRTLIGKRHEYIPIQPNADGAMFSERTGLYLVRWHGIHQDVEATWLRWADADGKLLPTANEIAEQAQYEAKQAQREAEQAQRETEQAQQKTRELETLLAKYRAQFGDIAE